jgi:EAL domain-containing protein (putative c-di-GMP-specific phosphodiesterase class I)
LYKIPDWTSHQAKLGNVAPSAIVAELEQQHMQEKLSLNVLQKKVKALREDRKLAEEANHLLSADTVSFACFLH